jgi:hypothetical protein
MVRLILMKEDLHNLGKMIVLLGWMQIVGLGGLELKEMGMVRLMGMCIP